MLNALLILGDMHMQDVSNYKKEIVAYFGYWPKFCDAPILEYRQAGDSIDLLIEYVDSDKNLRARVSLEFSGVSGNTLSEFETGSVIDVLEILAGDQFRVSIVPCFSMGGSFKCASVVAEIANA